MKGKCCFSEACVCRFKLVTSPDMKQLFILGQEKWGGTPRDLCRKRESRKFFLPLLCLSCLQPKVINMPKPRIWGGMGVDQGTENHCVDKGLDGSVLKARTMGLRQQGLSLL